MPAEPNPFEPPRAALRPVDPAAQRTTLGRWLTGLGAAGCVAVGAFYLLVAVPFQRRDFPAAVRRDDIAAAWAYIGIGAISLALLARSIVVGRARARRESGGAGDPPDPASA